MAKVTSKPTAAVEQPVEPPVTERPAMVIPFAPVAENGMVQTAVVAEDAPDTVDMVFPHPVILTTDGTSRIMFKQGVHPVPLQYVDHPWLKQNKVRRAR